MSEENGAGGVCRTAQSIRRIMREYNEIKSSKNPYWTASPINEEEPYEWHFTVRGPVGTEFEGGIYHGKVVLPQNYPLAPPSFTLLNQNGRFEVGRKVCLSASNYHPELWQPAWGIRTMLDALHAFFATPADGSVHSLNWPADLRRKLARESTSWGCPVCGDDNATLIAKYCGDPTSIRPALPSSMIPSFVAKTCPYLQTSNTSNESPIDPATTSEVSTEPQPTTNRLSEEQRRRRRARAADHPVNHRLTLHELFMIFIGMPITHTLSYLFNSSVRKSEKTVVLIDAISCVLILTTGVLLVDIFWRPALLGHIFLMDGVS